MGMAVGAAALPAAPAGAAQGAPGHASNNRVLGHGGVHHTAIRTRDWQRTLDFYQTVLGFTVKLAWQEVSGTMDERLAASATRPGNQQWAYLDSGDGTCVEIFEDPAFSPPAAGTTDPTNTPGSALVHMGIRTSRVDEVFARARAHGAALGNAPTDYTMHPVAGGSPVVVRIAFIQGPSGEWIELIQHAP